MTSSNFPTFGSRISTSLLKTHRIQNYQPSHENFRKSSFRDKIDKKVNKKVKKQNRHYPTCRDPRKARKKSKKATKIRTAVDTISKTQVQAISETSQVPRTINNWQFFAAKNIVLDNEKATIFRVQNGPLNNSISWRLASKHVDIFRKLKCQNNI